MEKGTGAVGQGYGPRGKIVLCDIDHTVSNASWRDAMIGCATWDEYHAASIDDQPIDEMRNLINALSHDYCVIGLTSRPEKWRKLTIEWLLRHNIMMEDILMRPDKDFRPAPEVKVDQAMIYRDDIAFILEDRDDVIAAFKAIGITALQVHVGGNNGQIRP